MECLSLDMRWKPTRQMKGCVVYDEEKINKLEEMIRNEEEKQKLLEILNKDRESTTQEDLDYVVNLFEKYDSIGYCKKKANELTEKAKTTIRDMPAELRTILSDLADYMINRNE